MWLRATWMLTGTTVLCLLSGLAMAQTAGPTTHPGNTVPSSRRELSLKASDVIKEVLVKPGDKISKGQTLLVLDDREEVIKRDIYKMEADSMVAVNAAKTAHKSKINDLKRVELMYDKKVATDQEYEKAKLDVELAALDIEKAELEHGQKVLQLKLQETLLQRMRIVSPVDGYVEEINCREGQMLDPKQAIIVVENHPLWVNVYLPTPVSLALKEREKASGQKQQLDVLYSNEPARKGSIIYYSPVADAAADVQLVRLELPNPEGKPAGLQVNVIVPDLGKAPAVSAKN